MRKPVSLLLASAFSVSIAAAISSTARADVKIVSKVTTTGGLGGGGFGGFRRGGDNEGGQAAPQVAPSPTQTYTTYFKGRKARRESADGSRVVIYDRDADKIYTIDPKAKTYYVVDYRSVIGDDAAPANNFMRQQTKVSLREPTASGAATNIGGVAARDFTVDGSQTITINTAVFGRRGNNTQGGNTQNNDRRGGFGGMSTAITGNISLASAAAVLPTELSSVPYDRTLVLPLLEQLQPIGDQIFKPLVTSIARQQSVPLAAKISLQRTIQRTAPANNAGETAPPTPTLPPTVVTMEVQSIDRTATLDNALFTVPADFTAVAAPQPRNWNRRGGQGGQDGQRDGGRQERQGRQRDRNGTRPGTPANQNPAAF